MIISILVVQVKSYKGVIIHFFDHCTVKVLSKATCNVNSAWDTSALTTIIIVTSAVIIVASSVVIVTASVVIVATSIVIVATSIVIVSTSVVIVATSVVITTTIVIVVIRQAAIYPRCLSSLVLVKTSLKFCLIWSQAVLVKLVIALVLPLIELLQCLFDLLQSTQGLSIANIVNFLCNICIC